MIEPDDYANHLSDKHFTELYTEPINSPDYCLTKGNLYQDLLEDKSVERSDALDISRKLHNGEIAEAEQTVHDLLTRGDQD